MLDAVGTIFVFALAGIFIGDEIGRKIAVRMLIGSLIIAILLSPEFAVALVLAPIAMGVMIVGGVISIFKKL